MLHHHAMGGRQAPPRTRRFAPAVAVAASLAVAACGAPADPLAPPAADAPIAGADASKAGSIDFHAAHPNRVPGISAQADGDPPSGFVKVGTFLRTDLATAGRGGMRNVGTGTIELTGVVGRVTRAYLYWHAVTDSNDPTVLANVQVDGTPVVGENIGFSDDNCWNFDNSQAWVADVTDLVAAKRNGTYALTGFGAGSPATANGATLVVFYQDGLTSNDRDVVLYHGNDSNINNPFDAPGWNVTLNDILYDGGLAIMELHVADGQSFGDGAVFVNGETLIPAGNNWQGNTLPPTIGSANGLYDIRRFDVASFLDPGLNDLTLTIGSGSDCLALVTALVDLPGGAAPPPRFVFVPSTVSLSRSASINVYLFSSADFDATQAAAATTRMYIDGSTTGAPVAQRGAGYLTATGDYNGDGRADRIFAFRVSDLVAAGLTASPSSLVLADRTGAFLYEGSPELPPQIVP